MNKIDINLRVFPVLATDNRTGEELAIEVPVTREQLRAAGIVGQSSKELVIRLCQRQGYTVFEVGQPEKRTITLDLTELIAWDDGRKAESCRPSGSWMKQRTDDDTEVDT